MKKILLPTDFSENSINAIHYALQFYKYEQCKFYLLNVQKASSFVTDDLMTMQPSATIFNSLISSVKEQIESLTKDLQQEYENALHDFKSIVDYDNFIEAINNLVDVEQIDLIIMGTRGATKIGEKLFGSNTTRVIQHSNCPVIAIPNNYKYSQIMDVVFTSNYYTQYSYKDLKPLIDLVEKHDYMVHVIHVKDSEYITDYQENNRAFLDSCFSNVNHSFVALEQGDLFNSVTNYITTHKIDFLAMMSRKHSFLERLFITHPAERFAFDLKVPLLVMENTGEFYLK
ncbi:universal stress protein [Ichthyenterobacterium magnum]|uniref:Nucleotide-binding universal stress UspA family protein n=1 Tax=Ichthyenterobacterium magnum TaxID=1230530 RepID=A0A420DL34_9FLAO|nr:universal stress protein [Ichthyenterobacterium magnum]RKE94905.1 nucleotide-binding universal stress UspA family protein [Ichthyenterobacterium magnum]